MKSPYKAVMLAVVVLVVIVVGYYTMVDKGPGHNLAPGGGPIDRAVSTSGGRTLRDIDRLGGTTSTTPATPSDATSSGLGPIASATTGGATTPGTSGNPMGAGAGSTPATPTLGVTSPRPGELPMSSTGAATRPTTAPTPVSPYSAGTTGGSSMPVTFDNTPGVRIPDATPPTSIDLGRSAVVSEPSAPKEYTIKAGDTFASIAAKTLGSADKWHEIAQANPRVDPTKLKVGMTIRLPGKVTGGTTSTGATTERRATDTGASTSTSAGTTHTVRSGDTLGSISMKYYGSKSQWKKIYNANKAKIGPDPDRLPAGATLTIPPKN